MQSGNLIRYDFQSLIKCLRNKLNAGIEGQTGDRIPMDTNRWIGEKCFIDGEGKINQDNCACPQSMQ